MPEKDRDQEKNENKAEKDSAKAAEQASSEQADDAQALDAIALLKADHRKVEQLFDSYEKASTTRQKQEIARQVCNELIMHTLIEEEIFYPACSEKIDDQDLNEAQVEHDGAKVLIAELLSGSPEQDSYYDAKLKVLAEEIKHHVREEEKRGEGIFAKAKEAGIDTAELGQKLHSRKEELKTQCAQNGFDLPRTRSFYARVQSETGRYGKQDRRMERYSDMPDRDENGRFVSDDDERSRYRRRGRYREDEDYRGRGRSAQMRHRDESGRFTGNGDYGSSRSSRYEEDEDDYRRPSRGRGGWYGDEEGHAEAARGGWDERGGARRRSRNEDEDYGYGRSRSEDYGRSARSSRYDDEDSRRTGRGHSGWYGDAEGHSEASRRGWDERGASARGGSRYEDEDDDRRGLRSRSSRSAHGGWFGDSEGHSEAARRGWEDRR